MLEDFYAMFLDAQVGEAEIREEWAKVPVILPNFVRGEENLSLRKSGNDWKIVGF